MGTEIGERARASGVDNFCLQPSNGSVNASAEDTFKTDLTNAMVSMWFINDTATQ